MTKRSPDSLTPRQWRRISRQDMGIDKLTEMVYNDLRSLECETDQEAAEAMGKAAELLARFTGDIDRTTPRGILDNLPPWEYARRNIREKLLDRIPIKRNRFGYREDGWEPERVQDDRGRMQVIPEDKPTLEKRRAEWKTLTEWLGEHVDAGWLRGSELEPFPRQDDRAEEGVEGCDDPVGTYSLLATNLAECGDPKDVDKAEPTVGMEIDGQPLLYPGNENAIIGDTESGKTWFAIGCVAAEIRKGHHVAYIHFEEYSGQSTYERLIEVGLTREQILEHLLFIAPVVMPPRWAIYELLDNDPSLVVLDGVNEAMSLDKKSIVDRTDGWARFRRKLVTPFTEDGSAVLMCDHVPKSGSPSGQAFGTIHKGNTMAGTRLLLTAKKGFGRGRQGESKLFLTKDRYGHLAHLKPPVGARGSKPGKALIGHLVVDGTPEAEELLSIRKADHAKDSLVVKSTTQSASVSDNILAAFASVNGSGFPSFAALQTTMTANGHPVRQSTLRDELNKLVSQDLVDRREGPGRSVEFKLK